MYMQIVEHQPLQFSNQTLFTTTNLFMTRYFPCTLDGIYELKFLN